jgi:hypothetical protein
MAALIFDSGALIALERGDRAVGALIAAAAQDGIDAITSSVCVAQVWRDPARQQAKLARGLAGFSERPLDAPQARREGLLLARTGTSDVVDAAVVTLAENGDTIVTSDPRDIERLLDGVGTRALVMAV